MKKKAQPQNHLFTKSNEWLLKNTQWCYICKENERRYECMDISLEESKQFLYCFCPRRAQFWSIPHVLTAYSRVWHRDPSECLLDWQHSPEAPSQLRSRNNHVCMYDIKLLLIIIYCKVGAFVFELFVLPLLLPTPMNYNSSPHAVGSKAQWRVNDTLADFVQLAFYHKAEDFATEKFVVMSQEILILASQYFCYLNTFLNPTS